MAARNRSSRRRWSEQTPSLSEDEIRRRVASARVAALGTVNEDGSVHLVPITFVLDDDVMYSAIDHKPKTTRALTRLANIRRDPRVTILVEHYEDDWDRLWWCRIDGSARILTDGPDVERGRASLAAKYAQYGAQEPIGPWIMTSVEELTGWAATD